MQLEIVISRSLMIYKGFLQTLMKLVQVRILELITCSTTGTSMLVKRALISNETKISSSAFIERCLFSGWNLYYLHLVFQHERQLTLHTFSKKYLSFKFSCLPISSSRLKKEYISKKQFQSMLHDLFITLSTNITLMMNPFTFMYNICANYGIQYCIHTSAICNVTHFQGS